MSAASYEIYSALGRIPVLILTVVNICWIALLMKWELLSIRAYS